MSSATMSILGLYNYDPTIFDDFHIPADLDAQTLIHNILMECAEFEILYTDPEFMKFAIDAWSAKELPIWEALEATTKYEYDPIANYDRTEEYTDEITDTGLSTRTPNLTDTVTHNTTDATLHGMVNTQAQNSFENAGMVDAIRSTDSGTDSVSRTGTDTTAQTGTEQLNNSNTREISHSAHLFGNIAVTTTQQMIEQERAVSEFNIYNRIITDFQMRFCLMIY